MKVTLIAVISLLVLSARAETIGSKKLAITSFTGSTPYIMVSEDGSTHEGFIVDLLNHLAGDLGFSYEIHQVPDMRYGTVDRQTGEWSGMIGEVVRGEADMAVGDITITAKRETAVDFTFPIHFLGLSILYSKGGRAYGLKSLEDIANLDSVKIGTVVGGSTYNFFSNSNVSLHKQIFAKMEQDTGVFTTSNQEGIDKVLAGNGNYAFIMESTSATYAMARNCELTQIGETFNKRAYGFALPHGSPYREELSVAILNLHESGTTEELFNKWFTTVDPPCSHGSNTVLDWITEFF